MSTLTEEIKKPQTSNGVDRPSANALEHEAIYIMREVAAQFEKPVLLFSGGKDSITLVRLAQKAFWPAKIPFPLMHIDTGHNFPETIEFRDRLVEELGVELIVRNVQDSIDEGKVVEETGKYASRNMLQTTTLLDAIEEFKFDACIGGARRDEEKARAKERIFSVRDDFGQWDEKNQRPELFDMLNGQIEMGQNVRVFPISNWTELDVWSYIQKENIEIPSIYFAHKRKTFLRDGLIWSAEDEVVFRAEDEKVEERMVRFRTVG
ncbi:MAG: sulfate adenylyltransferase subunit 2, partial [Muricauda sp.]|nr:sulfate adenylyltransferase subunit 2 [Allomuricauda sp.]